MTMKNLYFVCYDVMDAKRLHRVFKLLRGFGEHVQYSAFLCNLSQMQKAELADLLSDIINLKEDRVLLINLGPSDGTSEKRIERLGQQGPPPEIAPVIV